MQFSFYESATGILSNYSFSGAEPQLAANTPSGYLPAPGALDPMRQRVDIAATAAARATDPNAAPVVVAYQPPMPTDTSQAWTWDATTASWIGSPTLATVQAEQVALLAAAYASAIAQPVSFTTKAGVTQTYQADPAAISNVANMQLAFAGSGSTPSGFYWVAADNTQVPFSYADVQGLAAAMGTQGFTAFAKLQTLKAQVRAANSAAAVQAVAW
ncbi:MAG: DUF4376 domain-containing protein [Burkholderiales bacterium]|nr:DUF4376 domain-containing protein [Burkholderiales bacterium]